MAGQLAAVAALLAKETLAPDEAAALVDGVTGHAHALLRHIDAENSVLLPESEQRLRRAGVLELPDRPLAEEERGRPRGRRRRGRSSATRRSTTAARCAAKAAPSVPRTAPRATASSASGGATTEFGTTSSTGSAERAPASLVDTPGEHP